MQTDIVSNSFEAFHQRFLADRPREVVDAARIIFAAGFKAALIAQSHMDAPGFEGVRARFLQLCHASADAIFRPEATTFSPPKAEG